MARSRKGSRGFLEWLLLPLEWFLGRVLDGMQSSAHGGAQGLPCRDAQTGRWVSEDEVPVEDEQFRTSVEKAAD